MAFTTTGILNEEDEEVFYDNVILSENKITREEVQSGRQLRFVSLPEDNIKKLVVL
jgi:hypothetical protein